MKRTATIHALLLVAAAATALPAAAQTIDGQLEALYGPAIVTQDTDTGFGNNNIGVITWANGSELDAAHGFIQGNFLYLFLTGNLETNFNKLDVFFDSQSGGQAKLRGDNPNVDFNGLNRMGDDGSGNGLIFETGFESDYYLTFTNGDAGGGTYATFANFAETPTSGGGNGWYLGQGTAGSGALSGGSGPNIQITIDNHNTAGVGSTGCPASLSSGAGVQTGIEMRIPLDAIGNPSDCVRVVAFVNGSGHDFLSNQVLGAATGACNLGEPRTTDFRQQPGVQYFTVCGGVTAAPSSSWGRVKKIYR